MESHCRNDKRPRNATVIRSLFQIEDGISTGLAFFPSFELVAFIPFLAFFALFKLQSLSAFFLTILKKQKRDKRKYDFFDCVGMNAMNINEEGRSGS